MKNYTPALVNTGKSPFTFKRLFLGSSGAKNNYYRARHRSEDTYIMWIEAERFGKTFSFPCVLEEEGDPMIYQSGKSMNIKQQNMLMIQRWNLLVKPGTFQEDFMMEELVPEDFHKEYGEYKYKSAGLEEADDGEEGGERDDLPAMLEGETAPIQTEEGHEATEAAGERREDAPLAPEGESDDAQETESKHPAGDE